MAQEPRLRPPDGEPPDYGTDPNLFSIVLEHNGFFCGLRENLTYISGTADFFDYCNTDTFSLLWIEEFLKQFEYRFDGKLHVYWCKPRKDIRDGLQCIENDRDIVDMIRAAEVEKNLNLLVDHTNFLKRFPSTVAAADGGGSSATIHVPCASTNSEILQDMQSDSESDSDFDDSDFDIEDGDDDLFSNNVDRDVNDNNDVENDFELENEQALDDTELNLREEDQQHLQNKFKVFNPLVDMDNPIFKAGMVFSSVDELRTALTSYSVRNRVKVHKVKNDRRRLDVVCKPGCPWQLKATNDSRTGGFTIRLYAGKHTCQPSWELKALTAPFLATKFVDEIRDNQKIDLKTFAAKVQREFNMCPNRWKLGRARKEALNIIHGDEDGQFSLLWDYGQELRRSNPGSTFFLSTNRVQGIGDEPPKEHLATLYWSYGACKRGFLRGCRPLICVDGCHLKTKYKGQMLTAVAIDPNDCIYPLAMGIVEVECTSSWEWFLTTLKEDLNITNTAPFTIMSDKQKGLINAVEKVWSDAEHRFCVRHLYQNFQKAGNKGEVLKNNLWAIARSTNVAKWQKNLDKKQVDSAEAYEWVQNLVPNTWIKAFFNEFPKCDLLLNNHCEVFNSYILEAREMPIMHMLDTMFYKMMERIETKQRDALKWTGRICPKISKKIEKFTEWSKGAMVRPAGKGLYHVRTGEFERDYVVDFEARTCDCRRWQLSGIPCHHAIACCRTDRIDIESLVHSCYSIDAYMEAYGYNLVPLRGRVLWEQTNGVHVLPPLYTKVMGRPKKNRKKAPEEKEKNGARYVTRGGLTMHCSICGKADHNKKGHYKYVEKEVEQQDAVQVEQQDDVRVEQQDDVRVEQQDDVRVGEEADFDDPSILQNIIQQTPNPAMDPTQVVESMVFKMGQEERARVTNRSHGPLPEESSFVAAAREQIPAAKVRVTTATVRGRGKASKTASARGRGATQAKGQGRGKGRGKKRGITEATTSGPAPTIPATSARRRASYKTGPGSAHYLLFGNGSRQQKTTIPDLNVEPDAKEVPVTQNAPPCCSFECTSYCDQCMFT